MASVFTLKALGLNRQPNQIDLEDGSLTIAKNVAINRDNVLESRRGFKVYGDSFGSTSDRAKQLISYKDRILRHYSDVLQYDNGFGTFTNFAGSYLETAPGLRIKSIEFNGNLYFTTADGIMKIAARTAADFVAASGFVTQAGTIKAIDLSASPVYTFTDQSSFLTQDSAVAYRTVWGYRDLNNNLFLGTPSQRVEVYNSLLTLMLQDYMHVLSSLDNIGIGGSLIDDQNYVNTLKLETTASASDLRTNLISLAAKLDNNILYADNDGAPTGAPLEIGTATITAGVCTITFTSGTATDYFQSGSNIYLFGFVPASGVIDGAQVVSTVTATQITFNTAATGVVTLDANETIVSNEYRSIPQPVTPNTPASHDDLIEIQEYISNIISRLIQEPIAVISSVLSLAYIDILDVTKASTVKLDIAIPEGITSQYFLQIYRSAVFSAEGPAVLSLDVFPNDELQLVYEAFPTAAEIAAGTMTVIDIVPDAFRGANLYTNAATGEGILQANDIPPFAKDINVFKNSVFYANTRTKQRKDLSLIGIQNMIDDYNLNIIPTLTIATATSSITYRFTVGEAETFDILCGSGATLNAAGTASYFDVNSAENANLYRIYYKIGTAVAPASGGRILVEIVADAGDTSTKIAERTRDAFNILNADFIATNVTNTVSVSCTEVGITDDPVDGTTSFTFTVTNQGDGEDASTNTVLLSTDASPARAVDETANSLIRVINKNNAESVYGFYLSGAQEVPGRMFFESKTLDGQEFYIVSNNSNTGDSFNPSVAPDLLITSISTGSPTTMLVTTSTPHGLTNLDYVVISGTDSTPSIDGYRQITYVSPTTFRVNVTITVAGTTGGLTPVNNIEVSSNEEAKNRVYYSKQQQPESVPILNYFDVGAKDKEILRIFPLRDSLFVFKEDGLYRISGEAIPFNIALFDNSYILVAPDSISSVENVIYGWSRQGISSVTESGVRNISRPIDTDLLPLSSPNYPDFNTATWGVGYESDKSYTVFTITKPSDDKATVGYKYSSLTNTWTTTTKSFTCGIVNFIDDKMYAGAGDINSIEQERKTFSRVDYADREYTFFLDDTAYLNKVISLDSVTNIEPFDVFVQTQTLTIYDFNALLKKLDIDPGVSDTNYFSTLKLTAGANVRSALLDLTLKLDADPGVTDTNYNSLISDKTGSITVIATGPLFNITSAAHGLITGRQVTISGSNSVPNINGTYLVTVVDANNFTIPGITVTTAGTTGTFSTDNLDFIDIKNSYNAVISKLNLDPGVGFSNYQQISNDTTQEILIVAVDKVAKRITVAQELDYVVGDFVVFKSIDCEVQYGPNTFGGDPISLKHMREAQLLFESLAFTQGTISFATDLLPKFEEVVFDGDGNGRFGFDNFGSGFFGGASNGAPIRTYIPRNSQRCRYMIVKFKHRVAREKWVLFGVTITGETELSSRAYK